MKRFRLTAAFAAGALAGWSAVFLIGSAPPERGDGSTATRSRLEAVQQRMDRLDASLARLETQVASLGATARAPRVAAPAVDLPEQGEEGGAADSDRGRAVAAQMVESMTVQGEAIRRMLELGRNLESDLISRSGFSPQRAREIAARHEALTVEGRAEVDARREQGEDTYPLVIDGIDRMQRTLREELGDADYARYRHAMGMSTAVHIKRVLPGSSAANAGLLDGDVLLSYDGQRVMDLREVERIAAEGTAGVQVLLEVQRGDERMFLSTVHGALGITELNQLERMTREIEREREVRHVP